MSLIKRFLFSLGGLALLASPFVVRAAVDAVSTGLAAAGQTAGLGSICDGDASQCVAQFVGGFLNILLSLLGIVLLVYLLYAGFLWMTAGGDTKQVQTAKDTIRNLVIGAILLVASFAVSNFVLRSLGSVATGTSLAGPSGGSAGGSQVGGGGENNPSSNTNTVTNGTARRTYTAEDAALSTSDLCFDLASPQRTQCIDAVRGCIMRSTDPDYARTVTNCVTENHAGSIRECLQCGIASIDPRCEERNYITSGTGDAPIACAQCRQYAQDHLQSLATRLNNYRCATVNGDILFWCGDNSSGAYHPDWAGNQGKVCAYSPR